VKVARGAALSRPRAGIDGMISARQARCPLGTHRTTALEPEHLPHATRKWTDAADDGRNEGHEDSRDDEGAIPALDGFASRRAVVLECGGKGRATMKNPAMLPAAICLGALMTPVPSQAQLFTIPKDQMIELTAQNPFERFADGRPKVPDALIERARGLSSEEVWAVLPKEGFRNQYADGFRILHPDTKLVGRAFTVQFMPLRPDLDGVINSRAKAAGLPRMYNQTAIDMVQPGDVLVVDLFGQQEGGTIVGDNLFYYIMKTTKNGGLVVDGAIRDLEGISRMDMPAYFREVHPSAINNVMISGINIPVRIGKATVMPGDLVFGDSEGVYFIPPALVQKVVDNADEVHVHDEWTRKKFDEGRYKSSEIYGSPKDPDLKKEYDEYLKKRLEEIRKKNPQ
jgi:regulator of RNase E activity RraA